MHHSVVPYGGMDIRLVHSGPQHFIIACGHLHTSIALLQEKSLMFMARQLGGPQGWSVVLCQKFNFSYSSFTFSLSLFYNTVSAEWELLYQIKR